MRRQSLFITFEGGEGSGKTTQINKLADTLTQRDYKVITTREPGGVEESEKIRDLLVQRDGGEWSPLSECLLLYAARSLHVERLIRPALENGKIVICDRFSDSTMAYQGYGMGLDRSLITKIDELVLKGLKPDITFILDIPSEAGLQRSERRLAAESLKINQTEDRYEQLDLQFHKDLREGFLKIAEQAPERCFVLDATEDVSALSRKVLDIVERRLEA